MLFIDMSSVCLLIHIVYECLTVTFPIKLFHGPISFSFCVYMYLRPCLFQVNHVLLLFFHHVKH